MKRVFSSMSEVFHRWANQAQSEAQAGNVSFVGDQLYSYRTQVGAIVLSPAGTRWAVITSHRYSVSTSNHLREAARSCSHLATFHPETFNRGYGFKRAGSSYDFRALVQDELDAIADELPQACRRFSARHFERLQERQTKAQEFANAFRLGGLVWPIESGTQKDIGAKLRQREKEKAARERYESNKKWYWALVNAGKKHGVHIPIDHDWHAENFRVRFGSAVAEIQAKVDAFRHAELSEKRDAWRKGLIDQSYYHNGTGLPYEHGATLLRLRTDEREREIVETSHGASVLLSQALRLFRFCQAAQQRAKGWTLAEGVPAFQVGPYELRSIDAQGNAQVGCHSLPFAEMETLFNSLSDAQRNAEVVA